jgi:hypothetical protein
VAVEDTALVILLTALVSVILDSTSTLPLKNVNSSVSAYLAYNATVPILLAVMDVKVAPAITGLVNAGQAIVVQVVRLKLPSRITIRIWELI